MAIRLSSDDDRCLKLAAVDLSRVYFYGTSTTILLVEANPDQAVIWTKPEDLPYDPNDPLRGLGHQRTGGFIAAFVDVTVRFFSNNVDKKLLQAAFTFRGMEDAAGL